MNVPRNSLEKNLRFLLNLKKNLFQNFKVEMSIFCDIVLCYTTAVRCQLHLFLTLLKRKG